MRLFNCNHCFYAYSKRAVLIFADIFSSIASPCHINFTFASPNPVYSSTAGYSEKRGWRNPQNAQERLAGECDMKIVMPYGTWL
jgi:hypothetical protein